MATATLDLTNGQIPMPGMPVPPPARRALNSRSILPGQAVQYHGRIRGGPRFGLIGTVTQTRARQAVVDMGASGIWHVPYYLLTVREAA